MNQQDLVVDMNLEFVIDELQITARTTTEQVCAALYSALIKASDTARLQDKIVSQHLWQAAENTAREVLQATQT